MIVSVLIVFFAMLVIGVPIGFTLGIAGVVGLLLMEAG